MPGHLKGPHTLESSCRWDSDFAVGNVGVVYEFDIKLPRIESDIDDDDFEEAAEYALDQLADDLRTRYSWIGRIGRAGRSGGWLTIEDAKGLATRAKLKNIIDMVSRAKTHFVRYLESEYPRE